MCLPTIAPPITFRAAALSKQDSSYGMQECKRARVTFGGEHLLGRLLTMISSSYFRHTPVCGASLQPALYCALCPRLQTPCPKMPPWPNVLSHCFYNLYTSPCWGLDGS